MRRSARAAGSAKPTPAATTSARALPRRRSSSAPVAWTRPWLDSSRPRRTSALRFVRRRATKAGRPSRAWATRWPRAGVAEPRGRYLPTPRRRGRRLGRAARRTRAVRFAAWSTSRSIPRDSTASCPTCRTFRRGRPEEIRGRSRISRAARRRRPATPTATRSPSTRRSLRRAASGRRRRTCRASSRSRGGTSKRGRTSSARSPTLTGRRPRRRCSPTSATSPFAISARLALGRVAHAAGRFDDSRYYYYLVPRDSDRLAEALYEAATSRYEKKDYPGARELLDELNAIQFASPLRRRSVDPGRVHRPRAVQFPEADKKLREFIARYEPVRDAARRVAEDDRRGDGAPHRGAHGERRRRSARSAALR